MKPYQNIIRALLPIFFIGLYTGCIKWEDTPDLVARMFGKVDYKPYDKTSLGRNILFVTVNGETITQARKTAARGRMTFQKDGEKYWVTKYSYAAYNVDEDGYTTIRANFYESSPCIDLKMKIPVRDIVEGATYVPEVSLYHVYLPRIREAFEDGYGDGPTIRTVRWPVYRLVTITEATVKIDTYYPEGDSTGIRPYRPVLSGEFSISGHFTDSLGRVVPIKACDGYFDVSDSPGLTPGTKNIWLYPSGAFEE